MWVVDRPFYDITLWPPSLSFHRFQMLAWRSAFLLISFPLTLLRMGRRRRWTWAVVRSQVNKILCGLKCWPRSFNCFCTQFCFVPRTTSPKKFTLSLDNRAGDVMNLCSRKGSWPSWESRIVWIGFYICIWWCAKSYATFVWPWTFKHPRRVDIKDDTGQIIQEYAWILW